MLRHHLVEEEVGAHAVGLGGTVRAAHLARTRHATPWSRPTTPEVVAPEGLIAEDGGIGADLVRAGPVFVDESGRRRRVGRAIGACIGALLLGYAAVVALTFAGVPVAGTLALPGVDALARPTGQDAADVGAGAGEVRLPDGASDAAGSATTTTAPRSAATPADPGAADADGASTTSSTAPATTTTTPGNRSTTSLPEPSSPTTRPGHGPPAEPPGKP
ncbi:MAG TPA: hypothetical protein VF743_02195 [Acidimicrobiales bacterium]